MKKLNRTIVMLASLTKRIVLTALIVINFLPIQSFLAIKFPNWGKVQAATHAITTQVDFNSGYFNKTESKTHEGDLKLEADGTWGPRAFKAPNLILGDQSGVASDGTYVYLLAGSNNEFMKYIPNENRWKTLARSPHYAYPGTNLTVLGNYVYAIYGGYQKEFSRYSIINNSWEDLSMLPDLIYSGASLANDGTNIYVLRGYGTGELWRYNIASSSWSSMSTSTSTFSAGASMVYHSGNLYVTRGASTNTLLRYQIGNDTWYTTTTGGAALAVVPGTLVSDHTATIKDGVIYVPRDSNDTAFYSYTIATNQWATLAALPYASRYVGAVYNAADDRIYVFRGNNLYDFWKYDPDPNQYEGLPNLPYAAATGADLIYNNGYLYYNRGGGTNYYRFKIADSTWETLNSSTAALSDDSKGVAVGNYQYHLTSSNTNTFYRYTYNTWEQLANAPGVARFGSSLAYLDPYIYAVQGNNSNDVWRFTMGTPGSWDNTSVPNLPDNAEAYYGARLISDGTSLYFVTGAGRQNLLKWTPGDSAWSIEATLPFAPYLGTDAVYYLDGVVKKIYFLAGYYKSDLWEYNLNTHTWRKMPDQPSAYVSDQGSYNGGSLEVNPNTGIMYSIYGNSLTWMNSFTPTGYNYPQNGTWTSETKDLDYASGWNSLSVSADIPSTAAVEVEMRSSANQENWTSWYAVSGESFPPELTPQRYVQFRLTLSATSDRTQTPVLQSLVLDYDTDTTAPSNPAAETYHGSSQSVGGAPLTSGESYPYSQPVFSWGEATDSETQVTGYYVYFGTSPSADPFTDGGFQTSNNFVVTQPMTNLPDNPDDGKYYLIVKAVNSANKVSEAFTVFEYHYSNVSPPDTFTWSSSEHFGLGTADSVTTTGGQIKLQNKPGFWQEERLSAFPINNYYGTNLAYVASTNKFYVMPSTNGNPSNRRLYEYDPITNAFTQKADNPAAIANGAALVEGPSGMIYGFQGGTNNFWMYSPTANTWNSPLDPANFPYVTSYGSDLVYDGQESIYALRGANDDAFYRYDTGNDQWEQLPNTDFGAPVLQQANTIGAGGDLTYGGEGKIYAIQGGSRTGFAVYDVETRTWSSLPNVPTLPSYGSEIEYDAQTNSIYYLAGWAKTEFYRYEINEQSWVRLQDVPGPVNYGSTLRIVGNQAYVARGGNSNSFYKYDITKNSWLIPTVGLFGGWYRGSESRTYGYGTDIAKGDGDNFYISRGNFDNLFYRYNAATGASTKLADAPMPFYYGSELAYDSVHNRIYALGNVYFRKLFYYDIATDTWAEDVDNPPPLDSALGTALTYDSANHDLYWARAAGFYLYDQDLETNRWGSALSNVPGAFGAGGDLVYKDDFVYALRGGNSNAFYSYNIGGSAWTIGGNKPADLPVGKNVSTEGFLVDGTIDGDYLYSCLANNTAECYRYSIEGNSWSAIATAPANISQGGSAASDGNQKILMIAGTGGTNTFNNGVYTYVMETASSSYASSGTYTSPVEDLTSVYKIAGLKVDYLANPNTSLLVETRTSADNVTWSDWAGASEQHTLGTDYYYKVNSPANRYFQTKFTLSSADGIGSGILNSYTLDFYSDTDKPENPLGIEVYNGASLSAALTTNRWYNHAGAYFKWAAPEATEGSTDQIAAGKVGSGIEGYHIYLGTENDVIPSEDPEAVFVTTNHYTAADLVSGEVYYFRMQAEDRAGNISNTVWQPFIYKYDNTPPENPVTISVDPSGYTTENNYSFTLKGASDTSGIAAYCYKYKTSPSAFSPEVCIDEMDDNFTATVSGVIAYDNGDSNNFYVKAKDRAGNLATVYATANYKYSMDAPGAPTDLRVTYPAGSNSNSVNEFAFSWDPPEPGSFNGSADSLRYYYWIGPAPTEGTAQNEVGLSTTSLVKGSYAQDTGLNRLYVVAMDEAGNIDYENYAMVQFTSATSAPGTPRNLDISDVSIKETEAWRLALTWDHPISTGSGITEYQVFRSETEDAICPPNPIDSPLFERVNSPRQTSYVDPELTQSTKYYCVRACNYANGKGCGVASSTVKMYPDGRWRVAPELTASPSAVIKTKSATISWTTSRTANSFVQYGKKSGEYGEETGSSTQVLSHSVELTGLEPGITYYYKAIWTDEDGNSASSDEISFSTNPAPVVSRVKTSNVSIHGAFVSLTISNAIRATVEFGKTLSYGGTESISTAKNESTYNVSLQNLIEGTSYNFRIKAEDDEGNIYYSDNYTFETLPVPKILTLKAQQVVGMPTATLRLLWSTNTSVSSVVTYYPSRFPERARDFVNLTLKKTHEAVIKDLQDETEYTVLITGKDAVGNQAEYPAQRITTASDFRPPLIENFNIDTTITGVGEEAKAKLVITWDTDEPSTTQVEYGQGTGGSYDQTTQEDKSLTSNHVVTITGLVPSTIYHLRAISKDKAENLANSGDMVIITPKSTKGALQIVVDNLSKSFGFLKGMDIK